MGQVYAQSYVERQRRNAAEAQNRAVANAEERAVAKFKDTIRAVLAEDDADNSEKIFAIKSLVRN